MPYGDSKYGTLLFSGSSDIDQPGGIVAPDISKQLPDVYNKAGKLRQLLDIFSEQITQLNNRAEEVRVQYAVETATFSLGRWEREFGISIDPSKSLATRRELISAKLRGIGTTTEQMIQRTASAFSGGDVMVEEVPGEYRFVVRFVGTLGIPSNMAGLIQILEEIKPAHLVYDFAYTYTFWDSLNFLTWTAAHEKTWNELRVYE
ncbi:putative phage tail protein [Paenibacillus sp. FSL H8-0122]|uniref:putative phage tail protein n=1 Tax=Paenibacillus sp. FSL H8-0122 TaxID=2954510 RepID=UPI0030F66C8C